MSIFFKNYNKISLESMKRKKKQNLYFNREDVTPVLNATGYQVEKQSKEVQSSEIHLYFWKKLISKLITIIMCKVKSLKNFNFYLNRKQLRPFIIQCTSYDRQKKDKYHAKLNCGRNGS